MMRKQETLVSPCAEHTLSFSHDVRMFDSLIRIPAGASGLAAAPSPLPYPPDPSNASRAPASPPRSRSTRAGAVREPAADVLPRARGRTPRSARCRRLRRARAVRRMRRTRPALRLQDKHARQCQVREMRHSSVETRLNGAKIQMSWQWLKTAKTRSKLLRPLELVPVSVVRVGRLLVFWNWPPHKGP
jgi:hypothetical protein